LLQPLQIPQWKWDEIGMDFIVGLPRTRTGYDSIWVAVDRLTKAAHFILVKTTYNSVVLAELYMAQIVCLHGVLKKIVSDRGTQFTSHFWQQLHEALGTHLKFSSAYHPQTDGQTERTNQNLEHMCDRTSQVIRPTYSCPCPSVFRQPCRCTWSLDKFGIWILYLVQERFTRHADIATHRRNEYAEAVTTTYFILKYRKSSIIRDQ
jgi:transposase InsO family protein